MSPAKTAAKPKAAKTAKSAETEAKAPAGKTRVFNAKSVSVMALNPRMSEKAYDLSHDMDTYVFEVPLSANKPEIAKAVAAQFKVTVEEVRVVVSKGKKARSIRIGGTRKYVYGVRPKVKKAYVKIKKGETIPIFASIDEAEEKAKKAEAKAAKKSEKSDVKDTKTEKAKKTATKPKEKKAEEKPKPRRGLFGFRRKPKERK